MKHHTITHKELIQAQLALLTAIVLQIVARHIGNDLLPGSQYFIILTELAMAALIGFTVNTPRTRAFHQILAVLILGLISIANISSLVYVLHSLVSGHGALNGETLLTSAIAIFMTNIIVFALWYWEIDSPGLTRTKWSRFDKDFQFTQQDMAKEFPGWQPQFIDYLFMSVINAFNGATTGAKPLTHQAKLLMASQAMISMFTLALVLARSVSILGT